MILDEEKSPSVNYLTKEKAMIGKDISLESWRQYEWVIPETGHTRTCLIQNPLTLYYEKGSSCHVVTAKATDGVIAYCVPSIGRYGCILTWGKADGGDPVLFVRASK